MSAALAKVYDINQLRLLAELAAVWLTAATTGESTAAASAARLSSLLDCQLIADWLNTCDKSDDGIE